MKLDLLMMNGKFNMMKAEENFILKNINFTIPLKIKFATWKFIFLINNCKMKALNFVIQS